MLIGQAVHTPKWNTIRSGLTSRHRGCRWGGSMVPRNKDSASVITNQILKKLEKIVMVFGQK